MNPAPHSVAGSEEPNGAAALASPAAPSQAATDATPAMRGDDASADAPDTAPDQLREMPPEQPPEVEPSAESSPAIATQTPAAPAAAPELSPAATGARLAELFPELFAAAGPGATGPAKPIKLRIHTDIQARAPGVFTKRMLGIFFSRYTTTNAYLKALTLAPHRFDLDSQPAGDISDEHRRLAAEELARRHALAAERRAAQRPPRREVPPGAGAMPEARQERRPAPRPDSLPAVRLPQLPHGGAPRSARPDAHGPEAPSSSLSAQPPRPPRHANRPPLTEQHPRPQRGEPAPQVQRAEAPAAMPADPAQRERAMLLHSFESSPLSKANFCALKGMSEAALDAALAQAQAERGQRGTPLNTAAPRSGGRR